MKKMSRFLSLFLALSIIFTLLPLGAFAAPVDSDGKPTDVSGQVFLAIYTAGNTFPGEPASYPTENYKCLGSNFQVVSSSTPFSSDGTQVLKSKLVNNLTKGGTGVWGVTSTTGGSDYLLPASGLVNEDGTHNAENEAKIVMAIKDCTAEEARYYTIIWYVIKHESDRSWHIDGLIVEKETFSVNYYGNGNTGGNAPTGVHGLLEGDTYTVSAKPDDLVRVDPDTGLEYSFVGWSTTADGTGQTYAAGSQILVTESLSLYAKWYLPTVYTITVITNLDGTPTDVENIHSHDVEGVFASMNGGQTFVSLPKTAEGTYSGSVTENGIYDIYFLHADGTYELAHGHQVVIYNESGKTELQNYSISYDTAGGVWAEGQDPGVTASHAYTAPVATANVPTRAGYVFAGWLDQNGKAVAPGGQITDSLTEKTVLTAQWERLENITVNIVINHGTDETDSRADAGYQLLHIYDGLNHPVGDAVSLTPESCNGWTYAYDAATNTSTYTAQGYNHTNMPAGDYNVSAVKAHYENEVVVTRDENGDTVITITYDYAPDDFDLEFDVEVDASVPADLYPQAVNVRLSYWGVKNGVYGWYPISQHDEASEPPVSVIIDPATGKGSGFYTVHKYNAQGTAGRFRVTVSSYVLPDGTVVAARSDDLVLYTGSIYQGTVTLPPSANGDGSVPDGSTLAGAYYDDTAEAQMGRPLVTVKVEPYDVVFDANGGTLGAEEILKLEDQYRYPDLSAYVPVHPDSRTQFVGWYLDEACTQPAEDLGGQYMASDITYYARWKTPMTVQGTIYADGTYVQNGETVVINDVDRAKQVMVVLQRHTDGAYNDVAAQLVTLSAYDENHIATGQYSFADLDQDSTYRVHVLLLNFDDRYDNEAEPGLDGVFTEEEATAVLGNDDVAQVDMHLDMAPALYTQYLKVDATQIAEGFRPDSVLSEVHYRDLGTNSAYQVIQQHVLPPYGVEMALQNGVGTGSFDVWRYHTNGTLYQYQMKITKLYGKVPGVFEPTGTAYVSGSAPYTIEHSAPSYYDEEYDGQAKWIVATLVPNRYRVNFALGLDAGETVQGMDEFHIDAGENVDYHYAYTHTWSYGANLVAFPYRAGYIFTGWQVDQADVGSVAVNNQGYVTVAPGLDHDVTLTATWQKVEEDTVGYAVRYLKTGTTQVLHGAKVVECAVGTVVTAAAEAGDVVIPGYEFDYASQDTVTVTGPVADHVLTLYYKETGVSEQVDSNLQMDKTATLEDNGTYTIWMETFTKDNPVTTLIRQDTPLDIVLVLDQSGSIIQQGYLDELQDSVAAFVTHIADHGRDHEVDHRIAIVGYAGDDDEPPTSTDTSEYPIAGGNTSQWVNTGLFDSNGVFHPYPVTGFIYTRYTGQLSADGTYYVRDVDGNYMLLRHHDEYRHLITEEEAKLAVMEGTTVYGYQNHEFIALTRNLSGLWTYTGSDGLVQLYSLPEFFTYHQDVWTHRNGMDRRNIHAYGTGDSYICTDGHDEVYTRAETTGSTYDLSVYADALVPVSVGANGSGGTHPGLLKSSQTLASNGGTFTQYGIEMANRIFAANNSAADQERVRIMVLFSDGLPGIGSFDETEANAALAKAKVTKNDYGAYVYTVGLFPNTAVDSESDVAVFMNGVSSNYPNAETMDDVYVDGSIASASSGMALNDGRTYYARTGYAWWGGYTYHELKYQEGTGWYYINSSNRTVVVSTNYNATTNSSGNVGSTRIYYNTGGYVATDRSGYYSTTQSVDELAGYFEHVVDEITTKITQQIILHEDTILRDIMGQGLVLTEDTVIKVYTQDGTYNAETQSIDWAVDANGDPILSDPIAVLDMSSGSTKSEEEADITYTDEDGNQVTKTVSRISVHNWDSENPTNPAGENYHPHTVDVTGYAFDDWYISDLHPNGKKMLVEITRVEARDEVEWGRSTATNYKDSGLWLPTDADGNRELLLPFDQPTTIFVERAYVLDYAKSFDLSGWYYDGKDEADTTTGAVHVDPAISDGMNWFDTTQPGNSVSTQYGNISVDAEGKVSYRPTKMNWGEYDQFYVFGDTWRNTVVSQDANENGNLWSKVSVIPASSVYYEDSFVTDAAEGIEGFQFTGAWEIIASDGADTNTETPEHLEDAPYGDVHGWIDSMVDDTGFSDGSAHGTGLDGKTGAGVTFTFTGTGVDVYTRTNIDSGYIMAILYEVTGEKQVMKKGLFVDNLAASGDYYQIPTVSFQGLSYGSYKVQIIANKKYAVDPDTLETLDGSNGGEAQYRTAYYVDGIRVYNPLGSDQTTENSDTAADTVVKDAYGKELNSVFTEVRDILLDNSSFTADQTAGTGAVFVDWIREGQGEGNDAPGTAQDSAQVGTYESLGPKNEVYLAPGQAVVLKVDPTNTYYVGMKKLTAAKAKTVTVHVSGIDDGQTPVSIPVGHTTDQSYQVSPDADGYIVIANDSSSGDILSLTKLRTANNLQFVGNGVQSVATREVVAVMASFSLRLQKRDEVPDTAPEETVPEETRPVVPEETVPEETTPVVPEETVPEETTPVVPEETVPGETTPEETQPDVPVGPSEDTIRKDAVAKELFGNVRTWLQK